MKLFKNLFTKKPTLHDLCIQEYGDEFGELYESMCSGRPIGGFFETAAAIQMIEDVKRKYKGQYR